MAPLQNRSSLAAIFDFSYYALGLVPILGVVYGLKRLRGAFHPGWEMANKGLGGKKGDGKPEQFGVRVDRAATGAPVAEEKEYDFIIIGGGTAGSVLASRLSAPFIDPPLKILVLESGPLTKPPLESFIPAAMTKVHASKKTDWQVWTEEQREMRCRDDEGGRGFGLGRKVRWPRGRLLGGSSAVNNMVCHHASPGDFDEWEKLGNKGWGYESLKPYYSKSERLVVSPDWPLGPSHRTFNSGPMPISYSHFHPLSRAFMQASSSIGIDTVGDFNTNENNRGTNGVSRIQTFINKGERCSAATGYLTPDVVQRANLDIATGMNVTKITFEEGKKSRPRANGVEFTKFLENPGTVRPDRRKIYRAIAKRDVLLCGGSICSPQILKLSGIGPKQELESFGIPVIKDLPGVGENLKDHLFFLENYVVKEGSSLQYLYHEYGIKSLAALFEWLNKRTGPMTSNLAESMNFVSSQDPKINKLAGLEPPKVETDPSLQSGPNCPDIEIIQGPIGFGALRNEGIPAIDYFSVGPVLLKPRSSGNITLKSKDPLIGPKVDPRYLTNEDDKQVILWGLKLTLKLCEQEPLKSCLSRRVESRKGLNENEVLSLGDKKESSHEEIPSVPDLKNHSDETLIKWISKYGETVYHPVSTVAMGSEASEGCLDNRLRIWGVDGLRVIDASVFPTQISGHPMATVIAIAEKLSEEISKEVLLERKK